MVSRKIKIGDVFSVQINADYVKFFQYIANDSTQLNSNVIRVFKNEYSINAVPQMVDIVNDTVDFYAHCMVNIGIKLAIWAKVGTISQVGDISQIMFRGTNDYGHKRGEEPVNVSQNWYVWRINDPAFSYVGILDEKAKDAEIGIVVNPVSIVQRIRTGRYDFFYPGF